MEVGKHQKNEITFENIINSFILELKALSISLPIAIDELSASFEKNNNIADIFENANDREKLKIKDNVSHYEIIKFLKQIIQHNVALTIVPKSLFVSLISQYDAFLNNLLKHIFSNIPELIISSEKNLNYGSILQYNSIEQLKDFIIEKEVESILRKSHADHFQIMEKKFDVKLRKGLDIWPQFIELTERRHLFVHTGSIVTSQYIDVCKNHEAKTKETNNVSVGDKLLVTKKYFNNSYNVLIEIGIKLAHVLWRKLFPKDRKNADLQLLNVAYDFLEEEEYNLAIILFKFAAELKHHSTQEIKKMFILNLALSYKLSGDRELSLQAISSIDWSDTRAKLRLAEAIIKSDYSEAIRIMSIIGHDNNEVSKDDYRCWPLFKEMRTNSDFQQKFFEIYNEPLIQSDQKDIIENVMKETNDAHLITEILTNQN